MNAGVHINASCGGDGACGKCRVIVEEGEVEGGIEGKLKRHDTEKGYRLACKSIVRGDVKIRVPVESDVDSSALNKVSPRKTAKIKQMDLSDLKDKGLFVPPVEKLYIELPEPDSQDHIPDVSRIINHLKLNYGENRLQLTLPVIRKIPDILRQADFKVTITLERSVREGRTTKITNIQPGDRSVNNYAIAMDIGTTTVYGQVINLITGDALSEYGIFNSQISYGEDVISRIVFAEKEDGLNILNKAVLETINKVIYKIIRKASIDPDEISSITFAGNTTMTQLMLKVNPSYIRKSPYVPAASIYPPMKADELGIDINDHATALVYTQISSYVGGDIVAGVMGSGMHLNSEITLFLDIGTNAEIVIGNNEWLVCAACSAGPAFEGGGIEFGMRASKGAIEDFSVDPLTLEPMLLTIGSIKPRGICGSGLIIMVAALFETGIIDNLGKFNRDLNTDRIRERDNTWEYVLAYQEQTQIDRDITISEIDIDNLIRAKGAIYSGCQTLLSEVGYTMDMLDRIILAGGFGSYIDLEKAMTIGLLPEIDSEKVTFVGNGSLMGAKMSSLTNRIRKDVVDVTNKMTNFELSETPSFMDNYIAALFIPHTDMTDFPKLKERMNTNKKKRKS